MADDIREPVYGSSAQALRIGLAAYRAWRAHLSACDRCTGATLGPPCPDESALWWASYRAATAPRTETAR